jgi:hypothetical protein
MPLSALPERLQNPDAWKGTDWDVWYLRWILKYPWVHGLFSYGPRATQGWARWRVPALNVVKLGDHRAWRYETDPWSKKEYLSRIQYYKRWHLQIQWPFMIAFHFYFREADVPSLIDPLPNTDNKLFYFYIGAHYDQDCIYWCPSAFLGATWK